MAETREIAEIKDKSTGDVNELRDKKVATATDASSAADVTSSLKFLLLNGTTGQFETALKSYVDEAVRQALGTLVSGMDKGTGASKILATDSSNDLGTITPANLATILGAGVLLVNPPDNPDLLLTQYNNKIVWTRFVNNPSCPISGHCGVLSINTSYAIQFAVNVDSGGSDIYVRNSTNSVTFKSWKKIQFV